MVPVVEVRRHDDVLERSPRQMHIGVIEHGLEAYDDDVRVHHAFAEAQHEQRPHHADAREDQFQHVLTRAREPINGSRSLRVRPCCSIRNLMASIGSGGPIL